jgi:hypothetical protein
MNLLSIQYVYLMFVVQSGCAGIEIPRHGPFGDQGNIYSVATSPTGSNIAVVGRYGRSSYGRLSIYSTKTGREIGARLWPPGRPTGGFLDVTFDPSGTMLAASDEAGYVTLWQLRESAKPEKDTLSLVARFRMPADDLAFSPNGSLLALACTDAVVRLFDVATREITATLHGHERPISAVAFSHDGLRLASAGSTDGTVNIWDVERRTVLLSLRRGTADVTGVAFSPNANWVVASYGARFHPTPQPRLTMEYPDEQVRIWDAASGKLIRSIQAGGDRVMSVDLSPDAQRIAIGYTYKKAGRGNSIAIVTVDSGKHECTLQGRWRRPMASWCSDGEHVVVVSGSRITFWGVADAAAPKRLWEKRWRWRDKIPVASHLPKSGSPAEESGDTSRHGD